jgi:hypothetical protein
MAGHWVVRLRDAAGREDDAFRLPFVQCFTYCGDSQRRRHCCILAARCWHPDRSTKLAIDLDRQLDVLRDQVGGVVCGPGLIMDRVLTAESLPKLLARCGMIGAAMRTRVRQDAVHCSVVIVGRWCRSLVVRLINSAIAVLNFSRSMSSADLLHGLSDPGQAAASSRGKFRRADQSM